MLLSEVELGASAPNPLSTVIGKTEPSLESDIKLSEPVPPGGSDVRLATGSEIVKAGSGLEHKFDELDTLDLELPRPRQQQARLGSCVVEQQRHSVARRRQRPVAYG